MAFIFWGVFVFVVSLFFCCDKSWKRLCYQLGQGCEKNVVEAKANYLIAAELDDVQGFYVVVVSFFGVFFYCLLQACGDTDCWSKRTILEDMLG
jgi:hypothetical protein